MARSHVIEYYLQVEHQYVEMLSTLNELKTLAAEKVVAAETYEAVVKEVEVLKTNYERIAYIMFLLNQPRRKNKRLDSSTLSWYKELKHHSKEAILDENNDVLCTIKQLIKEGLTKNED